MIYQIHISINWIKNIITMNIRIETHDYGRWPLLDSEYWKINWDCTAMKRQELGYSTTLYLIRRLNLVEEQNLIPSGCSPSIISCWAIFNKFFPIELLNSSNFWRDKFKFTSSTLISDNAIHHLSHDSIILKHSFVIIEDYHIPSKQNR